MNGLDGFFLVQLHLAAQEVVRVQVSGQQVGVADRGLVAVAVAGGTGIGSRTLGAHMYAAARVHPGDGAAAGANGVHFDHGHLDWETAQLGAGGEGHLVIVQQGQVAAGPADVDGHDIMLSQQLGHVDGR